MLENWHQMDGNWLVNHKYMHIYNAHMRLLPFSWFSMRLGMINSFLVVCFIMVQKYPVREKIYIILTRTSLHAYKTIFF